MLSPEFVNGKELRVEIGNLNSAGVLPDKLKTVGVKKPAMQEAFLAAVESIPADSEDAKKMPDSVVLFYNSIVEGEDPSPEEIAKLEEAKKKKARPSGPSNEQLAYDMLTAGKSEDEIGAAFTARYKERGQTDEKFVAKRIAIYIKIGKKRIAAESGAPAETPAKGEEEATK